MEKQREQILNGNLRSLLFKFSLPAITGMVVNALYNMVDTIFVGNGVGPLGIAALTIVFPIQFLMMAIGLMVGIGAASIISRSLGKGEKDMAVNTAGNAMIANMVISVFFMVFAFIFIDELLVFFGASPEVMPYAKDYMSVILLGFIFFSFAISSNNIIRSEGKPRAAMYPMLIGAITNIILDPIFIFVFRMGTRGAAIATIISQIASCTYIIIYLSSNKSIFKFNLRMFAVKFSLIKNILVIGFPTFLMQTIGSAVILIFNRVIIHYGSDLYIAIMGIGFRIITFIQMPIIGVSQGFATIVSFNYGAKNLARVKKILAEAILWTIAIAGPGFLVIMFFPEYLLRLFTSDTDLIIMGMNPIRIVVLFIPIVGLQILGGSFFQAIGRTVPALLITISRQLLLLIPALLILPTFLGLMGVWLAVPVSDFISIIITSTFILKEVRTFNRKLGAALP